MSSESKTRKQKIKRILSFFSAILVIMCILSTFVVNAASYTADWRNWCQGASDSSLMRKYGCWVVAQAKMIKMLNIDDSASFNPDYYMNWEIRNGYLNSRTFMQQNGVNAPVAYAEQKGKTLNYIGYKTGKNNIWNNINNGYYSILYFKTPSGGTHNVLVDNETSKQKNAIYFFQSYDGATYGPIKSYDEYVKTGRTLQGIYTYSYSVHSHSHSYGRNYETDHPHRVYMKCSCGDWYYTGETTKMDGCDLCYPIVHITLDANGGKNGTREIYYRAGIDKYYSDPQLNNEITSIATPQRNGYSFENYYGDGSCGGNDGEQFIYGSSILEDNPKYYGGFAWDLCTDITQDATLYAKWTELPKSSYKAIDVKPGTYIIHSARDDNYVLDIEYDSTESGAKIHLYRDMGIDAQKFKIVKCDGYYLIQSYYSGHWLDILQPIKNNANVRLYNDNSFDDEHWIFEDAGNGYVCIKSMTGYYLDLQGSVAKDKANIQIWKFADNADQFWRLENTDHMPGDINGDGEVNTSDLVRLMKYMAGADVIAYYPDVNGDGIVATSDLIRLMKYISGADVTLYLSAPEPF